MIELRNIKKIYTQSSSTVHALKGIDLTVKAGEIFGIIGKSGAGKSTLIRCINLLEKPSAGSVVVDGQELTALPNAKLREARKKISMIFQHFNLLSSRTVFENIALPLELSKVPKKQIEQQVLPLLELVGLQDKKDYYPSQLSGGQKQRVGIARALASKPSVLLCDEATSALDPQTTKSILHLLRTINTKFNLTIVLITHEMQVIKEICDKVAVIENGSIIEQGSVLEIFSKPKHLSTKEFISNSDKDLTALLAEQEITARPAEGSSLLLKLSFIGQSAQEPIMSGLIRRFNITVNILYGNIDNIHGTTFGTLMVELSGEQSSIQNALSYLQTRDLGMEVIGYVARNTQAAV